MTNEEYICLFFFIIMLFSSFSAHSTEAQNQIVEGLEPHSITIIGERHKRPESIQFFRELISRYLQQDKCLTIALEIASNQQTTLDEIVEGRKIVADIEIPPMVDHPPYRSLMDDLVAMKRRGTCLKLIAIDGGELNVNRDEWMAERLAKQVRQAPILALLGNLHTLKRVDWYTSVSKVSPYVAEILVSQGHRIKSYPQIWLDKECSIQNGLISSDEQKTVSLINRSLISLLNAAKYETVNDVIDGVILWECG
ncbi:hypothetical protein [Nitrosomonas communis]|uniref:Haem-binding uptake Tiki superfamily ChaN domain-containing protein n=1 Tax=Nitrosomonas communis TaxID=44574 RepID=A0A1I4U023_9PROT|nr:hypothetical protein [Nitrosomonas communis]SFM82073.1 hypothetical protein SAMN05421863_10573 [Nitrosomonas communis]